MIGDNETNFPHNLVLTNRQVSNLRKALGRLLGPLLKTGLPLIKNMIEPCFNSFRINYSSISSRCGNT